MLGEAFLQVLNYTAEKPVPKKNLNLLTPPAESPLTNLTSSSPCTPQTLRAVRPEGPSKLRPRNSSVPSMALAIPVCSIEDHWNLEHLGSCFTPSFYQAYPDLQLAGGSVAPRYPLNRSPFATQSQSSLLNSQDLGSMDALEEPEQLADAPTDADEGYLVIEHAKSPGKEPRLTNSMLNGFLEKQLMEVYRQHMQDSLARCNSTSVVPELCPDLSTSHDPDKGLESSSDQSSVRYLSTCSAPPTSHFSSPVLRISYPQEPNS